MRVLRLLVGRPPQTVAELTAASGVTRTAITEQLNELLAGGFVQRSTEKTARRGRPRHLYAATKDALELLFDSNLRLVVPAMLRALRDVVGPESSRQVLDRVGSILAEYYGHRIEGDGPQERLKDFAGLLESEGIVVDLDHENGGLQLHERTCPFAEMVDDSREVCQMEQQMISAIVGLPVVLSDCRLDGCECCTFDLAESAGDLAEAAGNNADGD